MLAGTRRTPSGIAYDRAGPAGAPSVLLLHAGVADRRMWDGVWSALAVDHDVVRLDLRGYGDSTSSPTGALAPHEDVLETLTHLDVAHCHLVGASLGAGVAVEVALTSPGLAGSLVLVAPGGSLIPEMTPSLRAFVVAEDEAMAAGDLDAAVEANLACWVDGPRAREEVDPQLRAAVATMQRQAFEVTARWGAVEEAELDPPALERLAEVVAPTLVLTGDLDLDAIHDAATRVVEGIGGARHVRWPDVAHLPSMERAEDVVALLKSWWTEQEQRD